MGASRKSYTPNDLGLFRRPNDVMIGIVLEGVSASVFTGVENPKNNGVDGRELISKQVVRNAIFANFSRTELMQWRTSPRELSQALRRFNQLQFNLFCAAGVIALYKVDQTLNVGTSFWRPSNGHAARADRCRALRLVAKCFSISS